MNDIYENEDFSSNRVLNYSNKFIPITNKMPNFPSNPNFNFGNYILTPNSYNNKQNINYLYNQQNIPSDYLINNYNNNLNKRPKSAMKTRKIRKSNTSNNSNNISFNNYNKNNKFNINNKKNKRISIIKNNNTDVGNNNNIEEDYDINYNMNEFENIVNAINYNGFQKYQDEINDKKIIIKQLENSIAVLKNKKLYIRQPQDLNNDSINNINKNKEENTLDNYLKDKSYLDDNNNKQNNLNFEVKKHHSPSSIKSPILLPKIKNSFKKDNSQKKLNISKLYSQGGLFGIPPPDMEKKIKINKPQKKANS